MKAVLLSLYMMTNAFGNLIDILIMVTISGVIINQVKTIRHFVIFKDFM
jgi:hypothetical protein